MGLTPLPHISSRNPSRRQSSTDTWDYSYPGIQIIQPTPKGSPCPSEKSANEKRKVDRHKSLTKQDSFDRISEYPDEKSDTATSNNNKKIDTSQVDTFSTQLIRRAPLASLSSFKVSSIDYQDSDLRSLGSDSVFAESYADTDDEMEQFSTDSDQISDAQSPPNTRAANKLSMASTKVRVDVESIPLDCVKDVCETRKRNLLKSSSVHLVNTFETKAIIESQQNTSDDTSTFIKPTRPASYSGCTTNSLSNYNKNSNQNKINKTKSSECVDINVVIVDNRSIVSPSVILELPVISTQEEENPPIDPSLPGPSRKWSKETLF